uniref:Uncharacterized protein n=1 Tax=Anopheles atroparvus TaxID=41427 RepID=A0A182JA77_ANOAO
MAQETACGAFSTRLVECIMSTIISAAGEAKRTRERPKPDGPGCWSMLSSIAAAGVGTVEGVSVSARMPRIMSVSAVRRTELNCLAGTGAEPWYMASTITSRSSYGTSSISTGSGSEIFCRIRLKYGLQAASTTWWRCAERTRRPNARLFTTHERTTTTTTTTTDTMTHARATTLREASRPERDDNS